MESNERELICYNLLCDVFIEGAYSSLQLNNALSLVKDEKDRAYITNLFYGVLEKNVQFDYMIRKLADKKPKMSIELLIKMGLYRIRYMSIPSYAAVNEIVNLTKRIGKSGVSGFVNAVLRHSDKVTFPEEDGGEEYLSVVYSVPLWICEKLVSEYGYDFTKSFLACENNRLIHIRNNGRLIDRPKFEKMLSDGYISTEFGYYVRHNQLKTLDKCYYTVQSLSSMIAVNCYVQGIENKAPVVLDLCGAPGGKSVYLEELIEGADIYCCDLHPHRVELIKKYVRRMKSNVKVILGDATVIFPEWVNKCDIVICDVPCSGLGVYKSKPDILFNKKPRDIETVQKVQKNILENARNYVKVGGVLCYSTCTILKEENENNISEFLKNNPQFELDKIDSKYASGDGMVHLFPQENDGIDGFFVARMRRVR